MQRCKVLLAELQPDVLLSSALAGFESIVHLGIKPELQSLIAQKVQTLRELAQAAPQLMSCTASQALADVNGGHVLTSLCTGSMHGPHYALHIVVQCVSV